MFPTCIKLFIACNEMNNNLLMNALLTKDTIIEKL